MLFRGEFVANHIPLLWSADGAYTGHIAKANPLFELYPNGTNAIAILALTILTSRLIGIRQKLTIIGKYLHGIIRLRTFMVILNLRTP